MGTGSRIWEKISTAGHHVSQACGRILPSPEIQASRIIQVGDFRIDEESRTATVRGRELHLSGAEFDVLVFLTSHRKRLVTSQTKLTTKAEETELRQADFLPALMSLRKKLREEVPRAQYIQTEAWILYDFQSQLMNQKATIHHHGQRSHL